jgi:hypothetical protein
MSISDSRDDEYPDDMHLDNQCKAGDHQNLHIQHIDPNAQSLKE